MSKAGAVRSVVRGLAVFVVALLLFAAALALAFLAAFAPVAAVLFERTARRIYVNEETTGR